MQIIYKNDNSKLFWEKWNEYIKDNLSSFRYLPLYIDYMLYYSNYLYKDSSFVVVNNDKCVGICFLPIEKDKYKSITLSGGYTIAPLAINSKIEKVIFEEIENIVKNENIKIIKFFLDPLIIVYKQNFNTLLKYGFLDTSATDCLVDLRKDKKELWRNIRRRYKSMINKVIKDNNFEIFIMNKENANYDIHEYYRVLHHKCAGKITRSKKTFDKQYEMLKEGFATLIGLKYKDKFIGMQYFFQYQKTVVYASGADDPEYTENKFNIYHPILWQAQIYFKKKGFEFLEYSQPCGYSKVQGFDDYLDEKQLNISYFKRGMGSKMLTLYRGIKYYDKELLIKDIENFKIRLIR